MNTITPVDLHTLLLNRIVRVEFTKTNGDNRVMNCTLHPNWCPEKNQSNGTLLTEVPKSHFSVWDVDAEGWRSFRLESIKSVEVDGVEYVPSRQVLTG